MGEKRREHRSQTPSTCLPSQLPLPTRSPINIEKTWRYLSRPPVAVSGDVSGQKFTQCFDHSHHGLVSGSVSAAVSSNTVSVSQHTSHINRWTCLDNKTLDIDPITTHNTRRSHATPPIHAYKQTRAHIHQLHIVRLITSNSALPQPTIFVSPIPIYIISYHIISNAIHDSGGLTGSPNCARSRLYSFSAVPSLRCIYGHACTNIGQTYTHITHTHTCIHAYTHIHIHTYTHIDTAIRLQILVDIS